MPSIIARKSDVLWSYAGTVVSMLGNFLLLPLLLIFLSNDELGLWYVFLAISNLTALFEFGFNPTFARNIVYCMSGARRLTREGCDFSSVAEGIDWHLLKTVFKTTKLIFGAIAIVVLLIVLTLGSLYVDYVTRDMDGVGYWAAWGIFCLAIFMNLYFLRYLTYLRGLGDIAAENKSKTFARLIQLGLTGLLLFAGLGLVGAALGFLANGVLVRLFAKRYLGRHVDVAAGFKGDSEPVGQWEMKRVFSCVSRIAWRDGIVQFCCYASTQSTSILCSLFLGLAETGLYSILLQFGTAVYQFSSVPIKSHYPMYQSAFAVGDTSSMRHIVQKGLSAYYALFAFGTAGVLAIIFPLLPIFKPGIVPDAPLFIGLSCYLFLWNQHSIFCNLIVSTDRIPYMGGYLVAAALGTLLATAFVVGAGLGVWGLVLGQAVAQIAYNNWKWPCFVMKELEVSFASVLRAGFKEWGSRVKFGYSRR